jgi:hypothetical protein
LTFRDRGSSRYQAEQYPWLLTADPPICRVGPALAVLRRCERIRRGEWCLCRFAAADIADELERSGAPELAEYLATRLEPEDVDELALQLHAHLARATGDGDLDESLARLERDLNRIVEAGAGLTDEFSDDLD